ncbi:sulfurtransferase [Agrobacterium sp. rho-13.3]|uniref:sulfurtransferase n=1 Tax=Agrobacterium sp. rho-13.3 TaxID=3072980 RepID=UPI002A0C8DBC|nr:sulfurtransferase [Agrobacterium sp. rho-13.3]MDX8306610.1 sulfurtransferase [Agrobacterium sp. rho-13.3]MDX8307059.1 sulfurtransferase [Agrobacterium sp. rho-13.3]
MSKTKLIVSALTGLFFSTVSLTAASASDALVTADWLKQNLENPKVKVFEVSVDTGVYERGHIPGAANLNWHTDLVDKQRRDIASRENFQSLLQKAGVGDDTTIVLYGDNNNWFAAWGAWVFETYGLGDRVKILDGGRKLWEAEGLPLDTATKGTKETKLTLAEQNPEVRARFLDVVAVAEGKHNIKLIDIRSSDEYSGKIFAPDGVKELSVRAGHIPGAVNVPWGTIVNKDGTFKSADEIKKIYAEKGIDGSAPIITYCRIGERSSHTWFALKKILGYDVRNYDGSWTEYGNAVGVPIANPTGTVWTGK